MKNEKWTWWLLVIFLIVYLTGFYFFAHDKSAVVDAPFASITSFFNTVDLPLWNADEYCGVPAISSQAGAAKLNIVDAFFYEPLMFLQPFLNAPFLYICLNFLLLFSGLYLLLRKQKFSASVALFAAFLVVVMPQYTQLSLAQDSFHFLALSLIPFFIVVSENLYTRRTPLWFVLTVLLTSLILLRASLPIIGLAFLLQFFLVFYSSSYPLGRHSFSERVIFNVILFIGSFAAALLLSAFVTFQIWDFIPSAAKISNLTPSFNPSVMLNLVASHFIHNPEQTHVFMPDYIGIITLFLAGAALFFNRNKFTLAVFFIFIICFLVSFFQPLFFASLLLPLFLSLLAATGLQCFLDKMDERSSAFLLYTKIFILVVSIILCAVLAFKIVHEKLLLEMFGPLSLSIRNVFYMRLLLDIVRELAVILAAGLTVFFFSKNKVNPTAFVILLLFISIFDLGFASFNKAKDKAPTSAVSKSIISSQSERLFPIGMQASVKGNIIGTQSYCTHLYKNVLDKSGFHQADAAWSRNPFLAKYFRTVLQNDTIFEVAIPAMHLANEQYYLDHHLLDLSSTRFILSPVQFFDPLLEQKNNNAPFLYENPDFCPKAFWVDSVFVFSNYHDIFAELSKESFDVNDVAFIQQKAPFQVANTDSNQIDVIQVRTNQIKLNVRTVHPGLLVLTELYTPNSWVATIDGKPTNIFQTNHFLMSVFVPEGARRIEFTFQPRSLKIGIWISLTVLFSLVAALLYDFIRQFRLKRIR